MSRKFTIVKKVDITENALRSCTYDYSRRMELIDEKGPIWARPMLTNFMAIEGSYIQTLMEAGDMVYLGYLLQKKPD
jgi:hypothetical protein